MTTAEAVLDPGLNGSVEARKQVKNWSYIQSYWKSVKQKK